MAEIADPDPYLGFWEVSLKNDDDLPKKNIKKENNIKKYDNKNEYHLKNEYSQNPSQEYYYVVREKLIPIPKLSQSFSSSLQKPLLVFCSEPI